MSNIEICRLLMSALDRSPEGREQMSNKLNDLYNAYANGKKLISRKTDIAPGLDKLSFILLQFLLRSDEMNVNFGLHHHTEEFHPKMLLFPPPSSSDILCFILKVNLNVNVVKDGHQENYVANNDQQIKNGIQRVRMMLPANFSDAEMNQFEKAMHNMKYNHASMDIFGPFYTWILVVPGRYFHIRYARKDDKYKTYVKLPIKWLEKHSEHKIAHRTEGGFVFEYAKTNIFTLRKKRKWNMTYERKRHDV